MEEEIWKRIGNYNYEVSNLGHVRKLDSKMAIKPFKNNVGYYQVNLGYKIDIDGNHVLNDHGVKSQYLPMLSRLVAELFIPVPDDLAKLGYSTVTLEVNHKNENKADNYVDNLEWVTHRQNINYGTRIERQRKYALHMTEEHRRKLSEAAKKRGGPRNPCGKVKLEVTDPAGNVTVYASVKDAARALGYNSSRVHYNAKRGLKLDGYSFRKLK